VVGHLLLTNQAAVRLWVQVAMLYLLAHAFGALAGRLRQPPVVGSLLAGVALGPSVLGAVWPAAGAFMLPPGDGASPLGALSAFCLLMVLIVLGAQTNLPLLRRLGRAAAGVSAGSIVVPLIVGAAVAYAVAGGLISGDRLPGAVLLGGALGISSLPIIARLVVELGVANRDFGQLALAGATVNDIFGFLLLVAVAATYSPSLPGVLLPVGGFLALCILFAAVGQPAVDRMLRRARTAGPNLAGSLAVSIGVMLTAAAAMQAVHVEAALGAFFAGVALGRSRFSPSQPMRQLESFTSAFFAPVYFASAGLQVDLRAVDSPGRLGVLAVLLTATITSKAAGVALGARSAGLRGREVRALAVLLNGRGAMQVIIGTAGLRIGLLSSTGYTMLLAVSVAASAAVAPAFGRLVGRWPGGEAERQRLAREERNAVNVLVRGQRLLVATGSGKDADAAVVLDRAWPPEAELTLLSVQPRCCPAVLRCELLERPVRQLVVDAQDRVGAVLAEANLGYGLIGIGVPGRSPPGHALGPFADGVLNKTPLPVLLVRRAATANGEPMAPRRIAVAVTGTVASRAAEEVAIGLSARVGGELYLLHVTPGPDPSAGATPAQVNGEWLRSAARAALNDAGRRAGAHGLRAHTANWFAPTAGDGVTAFIRHHRIDVVLLGARLRRVRDTPFLGHTVASVLEAATAADIVIIAMPDAATGGSADEPYADRQYG